MGIRCKSAMLKSAAFDGANASDVACRCSEPELSAVGVCRVSGRRDLLAGWLSPDGVEDVMAAVGLPKKEGEMRIERKGSPMFGEVEIMRSHSE